jgi:hypothetical protein
MAKGKISVKQTKIDAKHARFVRSALRKASKGSGAGKAALAAGAAKAKSTAGAGACTITYGGGFKVCTPNVTNAACNAVAAETGGTPHFNPGGKC